MFQVGIERDANGGHNLSAECLGSTELFQAITRCVTSRSQAKDLEHLLVCPKCFDFISVFYMGELTAVVYDCRLQDRDANILC